MAKPESLLGVACNVTRTKDKTWVRSKRYTL